MKTYTLIALMVVAGCSAASTQPTDDSEPTKREAGFAPDGSNTSSSTSTTETPADSGPDGELALTDAGPDVVTIVDANVEAEAGNTGLSCSGTADSQSHGILNVPWTYTIVGGQACATAGGGAPECVACNLFPASNSPQCQVILAGPPDNRPWDFQYNPVAKVLYIKAVSVIPATWTPTCQ